MGFLSNLYEIVQLDGFDCKIMFSTSKHPIFKAHFPTNPILPGFIQIDICEEIFNLKINKIKKAKFLNIIKPEDIIDINLNISKKKIVLLKETTKMSEIIYE
ncbi:3-hydroxyacyl-ACP dehydratase [Arcobacter sp.]|uniref:3-hydroxyacyl-ACP dehydratase n=1 Tax=Arcobacter sp. TaxID=1872629 RepID=UPI003D0B1411